MFPGGIELAAIAGLAILLLGPRKIPQAARAVGQSMGEFRKGRRKSATEAEQEVNNE